MDKLYLCRHGETEWTVSGQHTGTTDLPLTKKEREQAAKLRKRIENIPFNAVFCSLLKRAEETCGEMKCLIDPNLVEWKYGQYEGKKTKDIHLTNPPWNIFKDGAPRGESPQYVQIERKVEEGMAAGNEGELTVALDTALNEDLLEEGLAREVVNKINSMRRELGFGVSSLKATLWQL